MYYVIKGSGLIAVGSESASIKADDAKSSATQHESTVASQVAGGETNAKNQEEPGRSVEPWCAIGSVKSMIGHCLGAAGALEAAVVVLTVARGVIPPTINHAETDPECGVDVVANLPRQVPVRCAVSTSLAFGGNDSALVVRAV